MPGLKKPLRRKIAPQPIPIPRYEPEKEEETIKPPSPPAPKRVYFTKVTFNPEGSFWRITTPVEEMDRQLYNTDMPFFLLDAIDGGRVRLNKRYVRSYYIASEEVPDK